ncbi:MAG: universal stress protein [Acidimicrobiales bacterium]|jgi:CPA2 family monovalent cation:H+ antiporter-2|nr:universal stress protein [Acidimicrobiales bacterium]
MSDTPTSPDAVGRHVLVGLDASVHATRALDWAIRLVRVTGGRLTLVHSVGLLDSLGQGPVVAHEARARIEQAFREEWTRPAREAGIAADLRLEEGAPTIIVPRVVAEVGADLVVLGARGEGGAPLELLGSTSHQVAAVTPVPVVLVP